MIVPNEFLPTVSFLYVKNENSFQVIGTAFHLLIRNENYTFAYIVTCKHVVENAARTGKPIYMRLNRSDDIDVDYARIESEWIYHDRTEIDLAVALLLPDGRPLELNAFDITYILTKHQREEINLSKALGVEVCFIGLFPQFAGNRRNFPIVRQGRIALITAEPVHGPYGAAIYHIIECQAHPGNSGSPVLLPLKKQNEMAFEWKILGVIQGYFPQPTKFSSVPIPSERGEKSLIEGYFNAHSGISLVTPAEHIIEILNKKLFVEQRAKRTGAGKLT